MQMLDDTSSQTPIRYQLYGNTLRLSPNKDDLLHQTFDSLTKTYPTVWVYCTHYDYMQVFDVTNFSDTQRNERLTKHHFLGVTPLHDKASLHRARLRDMTESDASALKKYMTLPRLT